MSEEIKPIGDFISNLEGMSQDFRKASIAYHRIFDNMPEDKKRIINLMSGSCGCWQCAAEAYNHVIYNDENKSEGDRIMEVGKWANNSLARLRDCMVCMNKNLQETLDAMDATSKWLRDRDWIGLPRPVDANGCEHEKTASEMYNDMVRFSKTLAEYERAIAKQSAMRGDDNNTRRDRYAR